MLQFYRNDFPSIKHYSSVYLYHAVFFKLTLYVGLECLHSETWLRRITTKTVTELYYF